MASSHQLRARPGHLPLLASPLGNRTSLWLLAFLLCLLIALSFVPGWEELPKRSVIVLTRLGLLVIGQKLHMRAQCQSRGLPQSSRYDHTPTSSSGPAADLITSIKMPKRGPFHVSTVSTPEGGPVSSSPTQEVAGEGAKGWCRSQSPSTKVRRGPTDRPARKMSRRKGPESRDRAVRRRPNQFDPTPNETKRIASVKRGA